MSIMILRSENDILQNIDLNQSLQQFVTYKVRKNCNNKKNIKN